MANAEEAIKRTAKLADAENDVNQINVEAD